MKVIQIVGNGERRAAVVLDEVEPGICVIGEECGPQGRFLLFVESGVSDVEVARWCRETAADVENGEVASLSPRH